MAASGIKAAGCRRHICCWFLSEVPRFAGPVERCPVSAGGANVLNYSRCDPVVDGNVSGNEQAVSELFLVNWVLIGRFASPSRLGVGEPSLVNRGV